MSKLNLIISTFFGSGYVSKIPGTFASFLTTVLLYFCFEILNFQNLIFIILFFFILLFYAFYAVKDSEKMFKIKDPKEIVIDEVLGQTIPLIFIVYLNQNNKILLDLEIYYFLSFICFRFFDILKPFPVSYFDRKYKNFFGIIMDDLIAGLYSVIIIYLISLKF